MFFALFLLLVVCSWAMAPHSSTLAWKIPWMEEPGRLQSMGLLRVRHDWATSLSLFIFMYWRRKWQPTPVVLAWRIPGTGEPGGLPSMGSHRVRHYWSDLAAAAAIFCLLFLFRPLGTHFRRFSFSLCFNFWIWNRSFICMEISYTNISVRHKILLQFTY